MFKQRYAIALTAALGTNLASAAPAYLVTEIHSNGAHDFWELTNIGDETGDLTGFSWDDDSMAAGTVSIPDGTSIAPGESIIFLEDDPATFRSYWGLPESVQVYNSPTDSVPGFGSGDTVYLFDASDNVVASLSYAAGGFTKSDGSDSNGGHAGPSAGGSDNAQSAVLDPAFGTDTPRYTFADGILLATTNPGGSETGSPGTSALNVSGPSFALTLSFSPETFSENAGTSASTGTVTRDGDTTEAVTVELTSNDEGEATVPASVIIPAGQASATFAVDAVDDSFPDGSQTVTISALATDAMPGSADLTVTDDGDVLDFSLGLTEILTQQSGTSPSGAEDYWELTNFGTEAVDISGFSWDDNSRSADAAAEWAFPSGTSIAAGESVIVTSADADDFRAWWGLDSSIQVIQTADAPGLGKGDGVAFFDASGNEIFYFTYEVGGFTQEDGSPSIGESDTDPTDASDPGHAGIAGGGSEDFHALVWVPTSGTESPRYTAATGSNYGTDAPVQGAELGSPGMVEGFENAFPVVVSDITSTSAIVTVTPSETGTLTIDLDSTRQVSSVLATQTVSAEAGVPVDVEFTGLNSEETYFLRASNEFDINPTTVGLDLAFSRFATLAMPTDEEPVFNGSLLSLVSRATLTEGAEIGAYDPTSGRVFVTSGAGLQVVDYSDPTNPVELSLITPSSNGADTDEITSTATSPTEDIVAVAVVGLPKTDPGQVAFYQASTGNFLGLVEVGALPDQIAFTPDGTKLLVCNEGQSADPDENDPLILPNPEGSVAVIAMNGNGTAPAQAAVATADFNAFDNQVEQLRSMGVRLYPNVTADETEVDNDTDLTVSQDLEPEAVAINEASTTAWVTLQENNAIAEIDLATATVTSIFPLGLKDHSLEGNQLDASNEDGKINIRNWPVLGMYMPDQVDTFEVNGKTYLLTANEGDGRDVDEARVADVTLDPDTFPNAVFLQNEANLGRLKISAVDGDTDGDGDYDELWSYGARSFTIWDAETGEVVFDSGDQFGKITAQLVPELFNADGGNAADFDDRSDDKGIEPEGLTIGTVNGRTFCFIGLERISGVMVYDITDPTAPSFVEFKQVPGDVAPEGLVFVDGADNPTGTPLLIVTNEDSNTMTTFTVEQLFTLELLHLADQEAAAAAIGDAPRLSAVLNALRAEDVGNDGIADNTLTLSSGDAIIPGLFFEASAAVFGTEGIADIQIQNELGIQAISLGNHEFDFGTGLLASLIDGSATGDFTSSFLDGTALDDADFAGANFPYLSTNLDFATDSSMAPLEVAGGQAPQSNVVSSSTVIDVNGESIAVVGTTTPTLASISSPGSLAIYPTGFEANPTSDQLDDLAAEIQAEVDAILLADADIDKVILLAHMQQISIEQELATRLSGVDIIVAGGSNTRLFDSNDRVREGDSVQGVYPIMSTDADGNPVAVVNTDGSYKYLGRLVLDFDAAGNIIPSSYDETVSGAYATDEQGVADLGAEALVDPEVQAIADAIEAQIIATEGNVFGIANVFLNGNRSGTFTALDPDGVRTQETNLGDLTADANLVYAQSIDPSVVLSIKNGGGIRASIGQTVVPAGGTEPIRLPNEEVRDSSDNLVKPAGGISENDIKTVLAFNNGLRLMTLTKSEILALLEHGVDALPGVAGAFPQVAGVKFSFDQTAASGSKLLDVALVDLNGEVTQVLMDNGMMVGDGDEQFRIVTLDFLSSPNFDASGNHIGAGDGYPFPNINTDASVGEVGPDAARVNVVELGDLAIGDGSATFADSGSEQDALAEYLLANHNSSASAYNETDLGPLYDERIQNLGFRMGTVFDSLGLDVFAASFGADATDNDTIMAYAYGIAPGTSGELVVDENGNVISRGSELFQIETGENEVGLTMTFLRRTNADEEGVVYTVQFSSDMETWYALEDVPLTIGTDGDVEVVTATIPFFTPDLEKSRFFR
ncbi:MAG: choice-of-anchor I family protein, partial [Verrucomicrobiota bacterium JB023]|nr:choice-of-anchor I family protein [Verrucomicrobiota bacterium JB023]